MVLITLSAVNAVSAADSSVIYVNNSGGNDSWDGQYAEWIVDTLSGPKKSIKNATGTVSEGGTVQIANEVYTGTGNTNITISRNMTITGQNKDKTIISGNDTNWIFKVVSNVNVTIQNLTMTNGNATYGGAIYNNGTLTVFDSIFLNNKATALGGAISNYNGTISSLKGCTFTNNSAGFGGAIDNNYCTIGTVIDCNFTGNNAIYGGAISNWEGNITTLSGSMFSNNAASKSGGAVGNYKGIITNWSNCNLTNNTAADEDYGGGAVFNYGTIANLSGCNFIGNNATDSGGAIYNNGTINVHFNIFLNNSATKGSAIYCSDGTVNAEYNWWGSKGNPSGKISGFAVSKWIVLTVNVSSTSINRGKTSTITADLLHDSDGVYHDPADGHVPDGVNVSFKSDYVGHVDSESVSTSNGIATTTFISENLGLATVSAAADSQTVNTQISVGRNDVYVSNAGSDIDGDGSQSNPFKTIKTGILNVFPGGRLHIADGTYTGENNTNMVISSDMTITGQSRDSTIINGTYSAQIFQIQNGVKVTIANLTLANGNATNGGAICNYGNVTVENSNFTGNNATYGGAILNLGNLTVTDSYFSANNATSGGAISNSGTLSIKNTKFNSNTAGNMGGAIYNAGDLTVSDGDFTDNRAISGGAIYNYADSGFSANLNVKNCTFTGNKAVGTASEAFGGAIFNLGALIIDNSAFNSNSAINGASIYNKNNSILNNITFISNTASSSAIYNYYGTMTVNNSNFTRNNAVEDGGAINNYYGTLKVNNSIFTENSVTGGDAIGGFCGGAIINYGTLMISSSIFRDNNAHSSGGAIYNRDGDVTVNNSVFIGNEAMNGAGAIGNGANLNVNSSIFEDNHVSGNPYTYSGLGGAISNGGNLIIHFSQFIRNTASNYHTPFPGNNIYNSGSLNIEYNWWGSNYGPGDSTCTGYPTYNIYSPFTWLVMNITAFPNLINNITTSTITVDLTHDNVGNYYDSDLGHVPDGIPVKFTTTLGNIDNQAFTVDGIAQNTLNGGLINGVADVTTIMDYQALDTFVSIDTIPPTVTTSDPANNTKTNSTNKVITIVFSESIQAGSVYDSISIIGPSGAVSIIKSIKGNVLTITPTSGYINGNYTVNIPVNAVTDLAGNGLETAFTSGFTVDTVQPMVTASPTKGVSNSSITVNLSSESDAIIYYRINNGSWHTFTGAGKVSITSSGTNKLEFYAIDAAGNPSSHTSYSYTIDKTAPVVTATPTGGLSKSISVTLSSESNAKIYYRLNGGSWHTFTGTGKVSITSAGTNKLEFYVVDRAGNPSAHKTYTYTIDKTDPKVAATSPKNGVIGVSRTSTVSIRLSENILKSVNWSKIYIKNLKTGSKCKITAWVSGNHIYIKTNSKRAAYTSYQVYILAAAVKDSAGNNLAATYAFKFKTGKY